MKKIIIWTVLIMLLSTAAFTQSAIELNRKAADQMFPLNTQQKDRSYVISILHDYSPGCTKIGWHCQGRPAKLSGTEYSRAIGVNSNSRIRISLPKEAVRVTGRYGLDDGVKETAASVEFAVEAAGSELMKSPVISHDNTAYKLDVKLPGTKEFDLIVTDGGDGPTFDQGDWCDLYVTYADGTGDYINDICTEPSVRQFPFSFMYGGKSSTEFIDTWEYSCSERKLNDRILRTAVWTDPATKLEIKAVISIYTEAPGIDYTMYITNTGKANTPIITDFKVLDAYFSAASCDRSMTEYDNPSYMEPESYSDGVIPALYRLRGTEGYMHFNQNDFMPITAELQKTPAVFGAEDSYSSAVDAFPFYTISCTGGGVVTAIGWTGAWKSTASLTADKSVRSTAQMRFLNTTLYPGETIRTPRILQCFFSGDRTTGSNLFRKTMLRYICPRNPDGTLQTAPLAHMSSCQHQDNSTTAEIEKQYIDTIPAHKLGLELYWLDAWWHKGGFPAGLGNYVYPLETSVDMERFPEGVKGIGKYAKDKGLKFLCWFAPETLSEGSLLAKAHPEWILPKGASNGNLNLGDPDALAYTIKFMNDCIKEWGIDWWRTDIGYTLSGIKKMEESTPDRIGILEIRQVEGLYKLWDALRHDNPGLCIDNCCGGGSRIDLETSARSISLWRTDCGVWAGGARNLNGMAMLNQDNNICLNQYVPMSQCAALGNQPYYIRSGFNYGMTFDDDNRGDDYDQKTLRKAVAECKRLQKYWFGDFYPIIFMSNKPEDWCAYQYDRPEEGDGAVLVFRRDKSPILSVELSLKAIDPDAMYRVDVYGESYTKTKSVTIKGAKLQNYSTAIKSAPGSALIEYKKIK